MIGVGSPLGLGSASPRRKALLEAVGIPLVVVTADVDERRMGSEAPEIYLERIVREKLRRVSADERASGTSVVLVADTVVLLGEQILGKPESAADALSMLERLSGRTHEVRTRFALGPPAGRAASAAATSVLHAETVSTTVEFRRLERGEIERYVATGEGADKAGGYAIQGIGSFAVSRIDGSYSNVVGLPVCEVVVALRTAGLLGVFP